MLALPTRDSRSKRGKSYDGALVSAVACWGAVGVDARNRDAGGPRVSADRVGRGGGEQGGGGVGREVKGIALRGGGSAGREGGREG